uniref:Uncharacterized protein n=1 Tax=Utricularia reniformis TaxID=192314 RepID=A0A1Y0B440_9LAMI|nr:hypothetical protein AEK19_MT1984 [Utricularia reniformis]ART32147.1 hypothetical protein AEK19_MT1984 [Utricularia reniformis]
MSPSKPATLSSFLASCLAALSLLLLSVPRPTIPSSGIGYGLFLLMSY